MKPLVRTSFLGTRPSCHPFPGWPFFCTDDQKPKLRALKGKGDWPFRSCVGNWGEFQIQTYRDRAEQGLRMCRDGRGLESNLVSFSKGFSKRPHILAIIKVDSEYLRSSVKLKVDYFILYSILVSTLVIFLLLFSMNKRRRTNESSLQ